MTSAPSRPAVAAHAAPSAPPPAATAAAAPAPAPVAHNAPAPPLTRGRSFAHARKAAPRLAARATGPTARPVQPARADLRPGFSAVVDRPRLRACCSHSLYAASPAARLAVMLAPPRRLRCGAARRAGKSGCRPPPGDFPAASAAPALAPASTAGSARCSPAARSSRPER